MTPDETEGDDGAIHDFWAFILRRRLQREPEFDLADLEQLAQAVAEFDAEVNA